MPKTTRENVVIRTRTKVENFGYDKERHYKVWMCRTTLPYVKNPLTDNFKRTEYVSQCTDPHCKKEFKTKASLLCHLKLGEVQCLICVQDKSKYSRPMKKSHSARHFRTVHKDLCNDDGSSNNEKWVEMWGTPLKKKRKSPASVYRRRKPSTRSVEYNKYSIDYADRKYYCRYCFKNHSSSAHLKQHNINKHSNSEKLH
jgi:hypothetical protein